MNSILRVFDRRAGYAIVAAVLVLATALSSLVSAAQVTERSIELSNSSVSSSAVTYKVNFTATQAAGAVVIDFCSDSPVLGEDCTAPSSFNVSAATPTDSGMTKGTLTAAAANKILIAGTIPAAATSITLTGVTNPDVAGPLYARIVTYAAATGASEAYTSAVPGAHLDDGGVAISITPTIGVSGTVREAMTFCISGTVIEQTCTGTLAPPVLTLGEQITPGVYALNSGNLSTGSIYTQITTNAVSGATVYLKSSAVDCGGLVNSSKPAGPANCDIKPAISAGVPTADFAAGTAFFGVKTATATATPSLPAGVTATGTLQPVGNYASAFYYLGYVAGNATGITSTFGDAFLNTNNAPVNNQNMQLTFGASVDGNTPAGTYSTALSLIATGKF